MDEISYICDSCGEEIVIPVDPCEGARQQYVEDCPVCCNPMVIEISIDPGGNPTAECRGEQDRF